MTDVLPALSDPEHGEDTPAPPGWQGITDDQLAVWALNKLAGYTAERDRIRANAKDWLDQIQRDALADEHPLTAKIDWFTSQLVAYYQTLPDPPATYKLPNGQIARRKGRTSAVVTDLDRFVEWAEQHAPDAVKRTALVSGLPADWARDGGVIVTPEGEQVPGVEVVTGEPTVTVKASGRPE